MNKNIIERNLFEDEFSVVYDISNKSIVSAEKLSDCKIYTVKNGTERIESGCFYDNDLIEINLPDSVRIIESKAFVYCRKLLRINFGNGLQQIKSDAFSGCNKLKNIHLPKTLTILEHLAFSGLPGNLSVSIHSDNSVFSSDKHFIFSKDKTRITHAIDSYRNKDVKIPDGVTVIAGRAFMQCNRIKSVDMPDSVITISKYAFDSCTSLQHIRLSKNIVELGECCFRMSNIREIKIPSSIKDIGADAFLMCSNLVSFQVDSENVNFETLNQVLFSKSAKTLIAYPLNNPNKSYTIPANVWKISAGAFMEANHLTEIKFSDTVVEIGAYAFADCANLNTIRWSKRLKRIKRNAFQNCSKLKAIKFPDSLLRIDEGAFEFCTNLSSVHLPINIIKIKRTAFLNPQKIEFKLSKCNKNFIVINNAVFEKRSDIQYSENWFKSKFNTNVPF